MPPRRRAAASAGPVPVESIVHGDKRANLPTPETADDFGTEDLHSVRKARYARDATLDPQLVWTGKNDVEDGDLVADAPPIYIQEKIDPRVLVEDLRRTAARPADEPELSLFESFDGLDELDLVDFYRHQANWSNRMVLGDSLQVMASLAERENLRGQVQMVYIDPPYGIKFGSNWQASTRRRDVKDGKHEDAAREAEQIKAFRDTWQLGIHSYLGYLRDRLLAARELLTESGSCFVQIGDENVHLVRSLMDEVFGRDNFVSQLTFKTTGGATSEFVGGTTDFVIWYAMNRDRTKFRTLYRPRLVGAAGGDATYSLIEAPDGTRLRLSRDALSTYSPSQGRLYRLQLLTSQGAGRAKGEGAASWFPVELAGRTFRPSMQARWKTNQTGMRRLISARRVEAAGNAINYVRFHDDFPAVPLNNLWDDTQSGSGLGKVYVVQTNAKVIERCMLMCTDPGDLVLDPTCGSGTTAFVAEQWGRRWITIDTSRVALALARQRIMGARFPYYLIADSAEGRAKEQQLAGGKPLPRAEVTNDIRHGFVYERVQHITLKSIANNPDIVEGMSRAEIDAAIKRHADYEVLYDKPYEDKSKVRVAGPFTVESLSPHRSLAFAGNDDASSRETISEQDAGTDPSGATFEQSILDNLAKAGIQNGRKQERITFGAVESYAGHYLQAIGESTTGAEDAGPPVRVGIAIGPQYGTVSPAFIKDAAKEAIRSGSVDLLCVLGFAFDAAATEVTDADGVSVTVTAETADIGSAAFAEVAGERRVGRIQVLLVRMNVDLLMGEDLKKTGAGNLFTVFGEPDIDVRRTDDGQVVVTLNGVDVYDPTTGEIRSNDTGQIALWMIDTDYDEESFFVRHCYFTGGNDPYKRLKVALKADIDPDAWDSLYRTQSRPFPRPASGRIAVKVINDYGDEVMKVYDV
jgi:adenine-specific DNA-methyltransferase